MLSNRLEVLTAKLEAMDVDPDLAGLIAEYVAVYILVEIKGAMDD